MAIRLEGCNSSVKGAKNCWQIQAARRHRQIFPIAGRVWSCDFKFQDFRNEKQNMSIVLSLPVLSVIETIEHCCSKLLPPASLPEDQRWWISMHFLARNNCSIIINYYNYFEDAETIFDHQCPFHLSSGHWIVVKIIGPHKAPGEAQLPSVSWPTCCALQSILVSLRLYCLFC